MKGYGAEGNLINYENLAQDISEEKNKNIWPRDHSCDISAKNVAVFYTLVQIFCLRLKRRYLD